ncbi:MAG TPA: hypothetical protein VFV17_03325, partial [Usitatibacteraceae bacterium]|nr:hypothetical protein [Usitatibacteraceae bacterium]
MRSAIQAVFHAGLVAVGFFGAVASAAICQFNQTSGAWNAPANWNNCSGGNGAPAGTPGPADRAEITGATAILPTGTFSVGDLYLGNATIQGAGIGATTLNVVAAGTIAWGSGFYIFNGLTVNLASTGAIPAANGPLSVTNAVLRLVGPSTHLLADSITITGAAAKMRNEGIFTPSNSLSIQSGALFENAPGAAFTPLTVFTINAVTGAFLNQADLNLPSGITVSLSGANNFTMSGPSARLVGSGTLSATGQVLTLSAGVVDGSPTFNVGTLLNNGATLRPGGPGGMIGTITVIGNYQQVKVSAVQEGKMEFDLAGIGNTDLLNVSGAVTLGGSLGRGAVGSFSPTVGTVLDVVNAGSITGSFDGGSELIVFDAPRRYVEVISATKVSLRANETVWVIGDAGDAASGAPTLRAALTAFNAESGTGCANAPYAMHFLLPMGASTIAPASPLPAISGCSNLLIDGTTQAGYAANSSIPDWNAAVPLELDGVSCSICSGLNPVATGAVIRGIRFKNWDRGINISATAHNVVVQGNEFLNNNEGIAHLGSEGVLIGGSGLSNRNLIGSSSSHGILSAAPSGPPVFIRNNAIGVGPSQSPLFNDIGIKVISGANHQIVDNVIGLGNIGVFVDTFFAFSAQSAASAAQRLPSPEAEAVAASAAGTTGAAGGTKGRAERALPQKSGLPAPVLATGIPLGTPVFLATNKIYGNNIGIVVDRGGPVHYDANNSIFGNSNLGIDLNNDDATANDDLT